MDDDEEMDDIAGFLQRGSAKSSQRYRGQDEEQEEEDAGGGAGTGEDSEGA